MSVLYCVGMQKYFKKFTEYFLLKLEYVSDVSRDIAQIFFAVFVVESFTRDHISWKLVSYGLLLGSAWWIVGIITFRINK